MRPGEGHCSVEAPEARGEGLVGGEGGAPELVRPGCGAVVRGEWRSMSGEWAECGCCSPVSGEAVSGRKGMVMRSVRVCVWKGCWPGCEGVIQR